ncbi:MAG: ABC transporter ATP-binding protein [Rhodospirillales bacterium]
MTGSERTVLEVENLNVDIASASGTIHPIRHIGFRVEKGKTLGLVGESGCGKSLTALSIMGLLPQQATRTADKLRLGDDDLLAMSSADLAQRIRGNRIAMIFQEPMTSLNPVYTIGRQLTEIMTLHRNVTQKEAAARAVDLLDMVGITAAASRLNQYPHQFSGGQRQRIMIAMALMNEPELLIADEPTTALDVTIQAQILHLLADLQSKLGMAMILITHDMGVISRISDDVAVMYAGEIIEAARTDRLFAAPRHPYTRGLMACIPEAGGVRPGTHLGSIPGMVPTLIGNIEGCAFANRCTEAADVCLKSPIPVQRLADGQSYRCTIDDVQWQARFGGHDAEKDAGMPPDAETPPNAGTSLCALEDVYCRFPVRRGMFLKKNWLSAINGVTLDLREGEILAIVGESGCGKTTLAKILLGLQSPDSGKALFKGTPLSGIEPLAIAKHIQPIFQDPYSSINPRKTIGQTIRRPLDVHDIGTEEERRRIAERTMESVGLPKTLYHRYPNQISGGQRQRVAVARAIIMNPDVVICDEPTSALDVSIQSQILNLLLDLRKEFGLTYILITHDLSVVRHMATRVAVMYLGRIVELGDAEQIFAAPRHPYTRALLNSTMSVEPSGGIPDNALGHNYPNAIDIPSGCFFHPRCPEAMAICASDRPVAGRSAGSRVECHLYDQAKNPAAIMPG